MPEYIEREAVLRWIDFASDGYTYLETTAKSARRDINEIPTADVVPVVHGRWYKDYTPHRPYCSVCDYRTWELTKYCPNCGARMDGDGDA